MFSIPSYQHIKLFSEVSALLSARPLFYFTCYLIGMEISGGKKLYLQSSLHVLGPGVDPFKEMFASLLPNV